MSITTLDASGIADQSRRKRGWTGRSCAAASINDVAMIKPSSKVPIDAELFNKAHIATSNSVRTGGKYLMA
jgi:hypothetical protein